MISYYQLKKMGKKVGEAQKLGQSCLKWEKLRKFGKKIGIICILIRKIIKKIKNEGNLKWHDNLLSIAKNKKKSRDAPKSGLNLSKLAKIDKNWYKNYKMRVF